MHFLNGTDQERAKLITGGVNFLLALNKAKEKEAFVKEALLLRQAYSLCGSMTNREQRFEAAFFESVRTLLVRFMTGGSSGKPYSLHEINTRINELLKASVQSSGVINLFSSIKEALSLFDPNFLAEIAKMKEKKPCGRDFEAADSRSGDGLQAHQSCQVREVLRDDSTHNECVF